MDRKKLWQRLLCWLLVLSLWAGNLPLAAVAAEVTGPETVTEETVLPEETAAAEETVPPEETVAAEHPAVQSDEGITFLWETENNDTPANANAFGNHYALRGELSETDREDWYRFTIGVRSSVATKASSHSDSLLYSLLDSTGETVLGTCKTDGLVAGGYLYYLNVTLNPGTYYLKVTNSAAVVAAYSIPVHYEDDPCTEHTYENGSCTLCGAAAPGQSDGTDGHLQPLPEAVCSGTNLWTALTPENIYYTVDGWGLFDNAPEVHSVTFPVTPGERVWATSFQKSGVNGNAANGTRITWFDEAGVLATVDRETVYAEFTKNGYITVPEGAAALNVPMSTGADTFELYLLDREHEYENGSCLGCGEAKPNDPETDLFVFAGQSNMMGAAVLEPERDVFTDMALEYKFMPRLRGAESGSFVSARNPAGEWHYKDLNAAYGDQLWDLSYLSNLSNYSANTYFCPAMRNGEKGFSGQSEADTYPAASLAPYFAAEYAAYGHSSVYAHMAKGAVKIDYYFNAEMVERYNALLSDYNTRNNTAYKALSAAGVSGAGAAFDDKYNAMLEDYASFAPEKTVQNKCFVWLQGEGDSGLSEIEYKLKMQVLWEHLQGLGFTHFFVLRVGYWGSAGILNVIKAQESFCAENDNCYIVTRAPSLIPYPGATTENWWISEPSAEYADCRDSCLTDSTNHHFNEKAMQLFAERSAENIHRILHQGLEPILEEENIQGMEGNGGLPEDDGTPYTSYIGAEDFHSNITVSKPQEVWIQSSSSSAHSTDLIPVKSSDSVWIRYVFIKSEAHAVGGFYDENGDLVAPLYYKQFGFAMDGNTGGVSAFYTPEPTNRVSVEAVEAETGRKIAFVRFTAWEASEGGHANTEARIYHSEGNDHGYKGKVISILSASTSTFAGWIPAADGFNLEHRARYPQDDLLSDVESTWWHQLITQLDARLGINESWAGSQVLNTRDTNSGDLGPDAAMASLTRIQNLGANGTPDLILFFGAGNDMGRGVALGSFDPATAPSEPELTAYKWDSLAEAYTETILRLRYFYPNARIVAMTTYAMPSYVMGAKLDKYGPVLKSICDHYGVEQVSLRDCGVTFDMLPDNIHPNAEGMDHITQAVLDYLLEHDDMEEGENTVYPVTHNLTNARASKHYYKGVSAGAAFEETLEGDSVTVIMGGVDITAQVYSDGYLSIPNVTGEVVITAEGVFDANGHLQALPEKLCPGVNLWKALDPENIYYTATGWGNLADGNSWSITFPVKPGDRVWATSLGAYPENGSSANGVRVTWFLEDGSVSSLARDVVYGEFSKNGYITAPEGAAALNLPMTGNEERYAVYLLSSSHSWADGNVVIKECSLCGTVEGGCRIDVPAEEVWIDGVQQTVYRNDSGTFVMLENTDAKIMTVYSYNDAGAEDPHTKYPTGMQVWRLRFENGAYTAEAMPEWENLLQYAGASIRVTGIKGIRMITALDKGLRDTLIEGTLGYTLVEYGTCVAWAQDLEGAAPVLTDGKTLHNYAYRRGEADPIFADTGDTVQYTNVLVGFTDDQLSKDLVLRPYLILENAAGQQITVYGGCVRRSIGYIAKQNETTFPEGTKADAYIQDIISKVYG